MGKFKRRTKTPTKSPASLKGRRHGLWTLPVGSGYDRAWWRWNAVNFAAFDEFTRDSGRPIVTARMVRGHGVSEAFMSDFVTAAPGGYERLGPIPRYLHVMPVTRCKHGHSLTDPKNVYVMIRKRKGVDHVERRCRACNRERVRRSRLRK